MKRFNFLKVGVIFSLLLFLYTNSFAQNFILKDGKKGLLGHMPSFNERLNETQEKALASYIRSLGDK